MNKISNIRFQFQSDVVHGQDLTTVVNHALSASLYSSIIVYDYMCYTTSYFRTQHFSSLFLCCFCSVTFSFAYAKLSEEIERKIFLHKQMTSVDFIHISNGKFFPFYNQTHLFQPKPTTYKFCNSTDLNWSNFQSKLCFEFEIEIVGGKKRFSTC